MIRVLIQVRRLKLITSSWCTVLLMKPMGSHKLRKFSAFHGKRRFHIPRLQQSATLPYPQPEGLHLTPLRPFLDDPLPYHTAIMTTLSKLRKFCSFPRQSPKQFMYFLSHLPAPHASPHQDNSVNYFVLINPQQLASEVNHV